MDLELTGKVALVTGSSRGIGRGIAKALYDEGCKVIINGRDKKSVKESAKNVGGLWVVGDACLEEEAQQLIASALTQCGRIDIVVANVGNGVSVPPGMEDGNEWNRMLSINLKSAVNIVSAARKPLAKTRGAILCISSICGISELGAPIGYSAAKAALNMYVRGISTVLAKEKVRINALLPGNVWFPDSTWDRKLKTNPETVQQMLDSQVPMARLGTVEEIAHVATFLCSPKTSFMTGTMVVVDGGQTRI